MVKQMQILFSESDSQVLAELVWEEFADPKAFALNRKANLLSAQSGFDRLLALESLPEITLYPHQQETVLKVLREMRGRAVLADEVGLGKTIEAGIIIKEYLLRGLARKVLILVPASLVTQWAEELCHNLQMPFQVQDGSLSWKEQMIVSSIDYAKRDPHRSRILGQKYDLLIVDEAHKLKNSATQNWRFVNEIQKKFLLLLTATPVQNDLKELYNIITLLKPGQLKTYREFKREFIQDKRTPRNLERLRSLLNEVVVRTNRRETLLKLPKRTVETLLVEQDEAERTFYIKTLSLVRELYREHDESKQNPLPLITLARELCSSPGAALSTLKVLAQKEKRLSAKSHSVWQELTELGQQIILPAKAKALLDLVGKGQDKLLIFTEFRLTQQYLAELLQQAGIPASLFHGGLNLAQKDAAIRSFRREVPVLISTEAGGEGRNLQFCHVLLNYDLPWNPMRIEQRIGRVHRLGQKKDVQIYNLAVRGSIEEHVLYLLQEKLRLFTNLMGEIESVISTSGESLEKQLADLLLGYQEPGEIDMALTRLASEVQDRFSAYDSIQEYTDQLLGVGGYTVAGAHK